MSSMGNMTLWCKHYENDPRVLAWLEKNPPPKEWQGSRLEYAYTEMPFTVLVFSPAVTR